MGCLLAFPAPPRAGRGTIHVMAYEHGGFEIGHESASGNSWGSFETFDVAADAIVAAYRLNRERYENSADVVLHDQVLATLPKPPLAPAWDGEF